MAVLSCADPERLQKIAMASRLFVAVQAELGIERKVAGRT